MRTRASASPIYRISVCWFRWILVLQIAMLAGATPSWSLKGKVKEGTYTSPRDWFSVKIPDPSNWATAPFEIQDTTEKNGKNYDLVAFYVKDFGEVFLASERHLHDTILAEMQEDDHRTVLSKSSTYALFDWRRNFPTEPMIVEEKFVDTRHGEALLRVFLAKDGSLLEVVKGGESRPFDTLIAVIVARKERRMLWAIAENDSEPEDKEALKRKLQAFFENIVLNPR